MNAAAVFLSAFRWDVVWQARNGFYWASAVLVLMVGGLLYALPEAARTNDAAWVPAVVVTVLQVTTFFFVTGLLLLERAEGTLTALAVSPASASGFLAVRTMSLTALATIEAFAIIWIAFGLTTAWPIVLFATLAMGVIYTGFGVVVASRYTALNALLLPASMVITVLLLPLLPHAGLAPRAPFLLHPLEPGMTLIRAAYLPTDLADVVFGVAGCLLWGAATFVWGRRSVVHMMRTASLEERP
jgi:fluoroquinolone transport system permease protein